MLKRRKILITAALILSSIIIFYFYISVSKPGGADSNSAATQTYDKDLLPVAVEALTVSEGKLIPFIEASGIIYGTKEAWAVSETQGQIIEMKVIPGQKVLEGDVLLKVEDKLAKLNRDLALQQYESSKLDFEAIETSYKSGGFSRTDYNNARSRLLQAETAYESAAKAFKDTAIRAPFDGSVAVVDSKLSVGNYLSPGTPVARIIDISSMRMEIAVGERQVSLIKTGIKAEVTLSTGFREQIIEAKVEAIGAGTDLETGSFPVLIRWENNAGDQLRSGLSAKVSIQTIDETKQIIIPSSAIVMREGKESVIVDENDKSVIRPIEIGETLGGYSVVSKGLEKDEILIVSALSSLGMDYPIKSTIVGTTGDWR